MTWQNVEQIIATKAKWMNDENIRPYVYVRPDNKIQSPGTRHHLNWFKSEPIYKNPLDLNELEFAEQIYFMEGSAFGPANMAMPRWVFYDCAVVPGFVAGFAARTSALPPEVKKVIRTSESNEWTPLSLFIIIPTMKKGEWVAHNLCSVNSLLPENLRYYGLGFLSKAFGLWYANVESCCGMTQWGSPALKLHSHYGHLEVLTAYTPVHSHARTVTYRVDVNTESWMQFFTREADLAFLENYKPAGFEIDPNDEANMIEFQHRLERGEGPYFLSAAEIQAKALKQPLSVYQPK